MIKLSYKGQKIFKAIRGCSPNELNAIQSIMYERVTPDNFEPLTGLPKDTLAELVNKNLVIVGE